MRVGGSRPALPESLGDADYLEILQLDTTLEHHVPASVAPLLLEIASTIWHLH